jgi:predicted CxxxxCH...CXXCH cytochrome family protein
MHAIARGMKCVTCHNGNTMPTVSNTIQMGFAMNGTNVPGFKDSKTGGSYDGFVPAAPYSFVTGDGGTTTVTQTGSNTCSNLYCHGGWTGSNGSITNPSWAGGATQAACGTCHGTTAATAPTAGSHGRHAANGAGQLALLCSTCHGTDPANNNHVNGRIYWSLATGDNRFGAGATYKTFANFSAAALAPYGSCTVYCHSSVQNATGSAVAAPTTSAVWGTPAPLTCDTSNCHGNPPAGGSHSTHNSYSYACAICHSGAGNETAKHADYKIDVAFSGIGAGGSYTQSAVNPPGNGFGSCGTIYCHSSGQSADGLSATPVYAGTAPAWGGTAACGSCHATTTMTTGSHTQHLALDTNCGNCHTGASAVAYSNAAHVNQLIDVAGSYTLGGAPGNGYGTCSTATCHGANSPVWGANTTNHTCTKCHGKPTTVANYSTARAWQAAPGYGTTGTDVAGQTGAFTNGVSNDAQVGAHDAHLRTINGYSDRQVLCTDCHGIPASGTHANGATDYSWSNLSKNIGTTGSVSSRGALVPTYIAGTCSTNYCHGGKLAGGADTTPGWTQTAYLTAYAKNATNCGRCHGAPPTAAPSTFAHAGIAITDDCAGCHNHNGSGPTHIDGTLYGAGNCDSCHDYDTVGATYAAGRWTGGTWGKNYLDGTVHEGWGAHAKHINYIKTRLSIATALDPANQTYGLAGTNPEKVCGTCHSNDTGNHSMGGGTVRSINFGDGTFKMGGAAAGTSLLFGTTFPAQNPLYNGVSGIASATTAKTCSNLSCHYFITPSW